MPVLAANQVTLAEVLEVKGCPLNEEEIWAILCETSKELEQILAQGKGKINGEPSLFIYPQSLVLVHSGHVKISSSSKKERYSNPTYRAPELNLNIVQPSDGAIEKMYVYALGMTMYYAAEYGLSKTKMANVSVSLGNVLLSMCEELARVRFSLRQVLKACGYKYGEKSYSEVIKGLCILVLGHNIPEIIPDKPKPFSKRRYNSEKQHPSSGIRSRYGTNLELPSPPLIRRASQGTTTSAQLVGDNERFSTTPEEPFESRSQNKFMTKIPHTLDKYRKYLEKARHKRSENVTSPVVADRSAVGIATVPFANGNHRVLPGRYKRAHSYHEDNKGYNEGPYNPPPIRSSGEKLRSGSYGSISVGHGSDALSETSTTNYRNSTLSSAPSSSLVSLMEGSYQLESSVNDNGSDYWGSTVSLRNDPSSTKSGSGLAISGDWFRSSVSDLRSVSQQSNRDHDTNTYFNGGFKLHHSEDEGRRHYLSEQNLATPKQSEQKIKHKKSPKYKLRNFFGPEFIKVSQDPNQSLVNISPKKEEKRITGRRMVVVEMLNRQRLEMFVETSTTVLELFTQVTKYIGLTEKIYFGLARFEDDEYIFLDFDKKVSKHAPQGWKDQSKKASNAKYHLYFRVKFYVENLSLHRLQETTHQFYLQLRNDIIHGNLYCDEDTVLNLGSLALQAEYGDYNKKKFGENYFTTKYYVPDRVSVDNEKLIGQKLRGLHKIQCGLSQEEAEMKFIKETQKLRDYGVHIYKTQLDKKENRFVYLGICVRGVTVYEPLVDGRKVLETYSWQVIQKLAFKKKKFILIPRTNQNIEKERKVVFYSPSYKKSKYLLYMCTSFHRFQMRMKVRLLTDEPIKEKPNSTTLLNGDYKNMDFHKERVENGVDAAEYSIQNQETQKPVVSGDGCETNLNTTPTGTFDDHPTLPYVMDATPVPSRYNADDKTPTRGSRKSELVLSPDRQVKAVRLKKDSRGAIGLTVVGGEDTRRLHFGIFIKKITPGSVADKDGRLQVGDRILAVNGKSLEYVCHDEAVQTLKNAIAHVELLVSQSTRTDTHIDMSVLATPSPPQHKQGANEGSSSPYQIADEFTAVCNDNNIEHQPKPPLYKPPYRTRTSSAGSSDFPQSTPSSPDVGSRGRQYGGVKLPGMENSAILRNVKVLKSRSSTVASDGETPGSFADYVETRNQQEIPAQNNTGLKLNEDLGPGITYEIQENLDASYSGDSRPRTPNIEEKLVLEQKNSDGIIKQLPVGVQYEDHHPNENDDLQAHQFIVELRKENGSLGLNVTGGINTSVEDGAIFVKSLYPNGPADLSGKIRVGHKIVSVNGISLQGVTHKQAVETIKRAPLDTVLVVERSSLVENHSTMNGDASRQDVASMFEVTLLKGIGGLGMSLVGGIDYSDQYGADIRIKAMFPGQPAGNSDQLRVGDVIMAANGISLQGRTNREAIDVLRDQPARVVLLVKRDSTSIPASLLRRGSFSQNIDPNEVLSAIHSKKESPKPKDSDVLRQPQIVDHNKSREQGSPRNTIVRQGAVDELDVKVEDDVKKARTGDGKSLVEPVSLEDDLPPPPPPPPPNDLVGDDSISPTPDTNQAELNDNALSAIEEDERLAPEEEVIDVILYKGSSGLGFTLAGGADTVGGCFVREIIGDPAKTEGTLRPKDQIVMVNGQDTTNKRHMEAVNILRSTRNEVYLVIKRRPDKIKSCTKNGLNIKTVSIIRTTRGRIGLELGQDKEGQICVEEVVPDEPAAKDGGLKRGDVILEINGTRIDKGDLSFAQQCLENAKPVVTVVLKQFRTDNESKYMISSPTESSEQSTPDNILTHSAPCIESNPEENTSDMRTNNEPPRHEVVSLETNEPIDLTSSQSLTNDSKFGTGTPKDPDHETRNYLIQKSDTPSNTNETITPVTHNNAEIVAEITASESFSQPPLDENRRSLSVKYSRHDISDEEDTKEDDALNNENKSSDEKSYNDEENEDSPLKKEIFVSDLLKGPRGLGFSLYSGRTIHDTPGLFIRNIQPGSVVDEDGKIKIGDQLLKVNDEYVETLDHSDVITMLRGLAGMVKLEMARFYEDDEIDVDDEDFLPLSLDEENEDDDEIKDELTTPDFSEDLDIILNAIDQEKEETLALKEENTTKEDEKSLAEEENQVNWPQPPPPPPTTTTVVHDSADEVPRRDEKLDYNDNIVTNSEDESTSVTFSEDDFLEDLEDSAYTPSPDTEIKRSGVGLPGFQALLSPRNISSRKHEINTKNNPSFSAENTPRTINNGEIIHPDSSASPLVPESFLNASHAISPSQTISPDIPPPLPTTPLPSDDDLTSSFGSRKQWLQRLEKVAARESSEPKGRFHMPLRPKSPLVMARPSLDEPVNGPMINITGHSELSLKTVITDLEDAISSGKAATEFHDLREMKPTDNCPSGKRALNKEKNRYRNVLPYEKTRVILSGDEHVDYINANFIDVVIENETNHYIATQGPLPVTMRDFWRMVWEQKCQVIAMVTLDMESGKVKCHRYWPESSELPIHINDHLEVQLVSVENRNNYVQRFLQIKNRENGEFLKVVHLNFIRWPDHGVPKSAVQLVNFIKDLRTFPNSGPCIVHCSAGIGRTGTLITVDTCIRKIEKGLEFDIFEIVFSLREQRPGMVQTKDQYIFCYQSCIEVLKSLVK